MTETPEKDWSQSPKYYVLGSDGTVVMGPTIRKQTADDHAAAMNRSNAPEDTRHWRVEEFSPDVY